MKLLIAFGLLLISLLPTQAQSFGTHWIASPQVDSTSQVWFKQLFVMPQRPHRATLTVISTGYFAVYVNNWKVDLASIAPYRSYGDTLIKGICYDVTRFMRRDSNVVAVWYSPVFPRIEPRQLSVSLVTTDSQGRTSVHNSDSGWLCHRATRSLNADGGETIDGQSYPLKWYNGFTDQALWQPAVNIKASPLLGYTIEEHFRPQMKMQKIRNQNYFDLVGDTVYYEFGLGFYGNLRVTIRDAKPGQVLHIGNLTYICNGKTDEQAISRFAPAYYRRIPVWGKNFRHKQIQNFEAIELAPVWPAF